ncbi:unnamed protein product, partial [Mesorhabditis belari]|uniref:Uncharacterized protein n=1 Tax=Mesorhabditis belari TaxID=2138241 RepID=A0AAF3FP84_9BILA
MSALLQSVIILVLAQTVQSTTCRNKTAYTGPCFADGDHCEPTGVCATSSLGLQCCPIDYVDLTMPKEELITCSNLKACTGPCFGMGDECEPKGRCAATDSGLQCCPMAHVVSSYNSDGSQSAQVGSCKRRDYVTLMNRNTADNCTKKKSNEETPSTFSDLSSITYLDTNLESL